MSYSKTDWGLAAGAGMSFLFALLAIFRPNNVLPANDQASITALVTSLVVCVLGLVTNRAAKHISGAR